MMSNDRPTPPNAADGFNRSPRWLVLLILCVSAVTWWQNSRSSTIGPPISPPNSRSETSTRPERSAEESRDHAPESRRDENEPTVVEVSPEPHEDGPLPENSANKVLVENQTIRNLEGKVVFKGTIDLTPTLDRIQRGGTNRHHNDGTTFQNREGRLPRKHNGYYKEYVHPTPGEHGPGPQRVIVGQEGEIWYTPDHYKSFREISPAS